MNLPGHIAIIMDGNGRWAKQKGLPRIKGHQEGALSVRAVVEECRRVGVKVLTLYAFSTENWQRPKLEVDFLMKLLRHFLRQEKQLLIDRNIGLNVLGDIQQLPKAVQKEIAGVMESTARNEAMTLNLALNYGARQEILAAVKRCAALGAADLDEAKFSSFLSTAGQPDPDLLIRTSGELRISNFLLWQIAYTELYFTDVLWPDFRQEELARAISAYQKRERRYGGL